MPRLDLIQYALHRERAQDRFEIGLRNLTPDETDQVLTLLARLQLAREG
jgi:hypothetical protein